MYNNYEHFCFDLVQNIKDTILEVESALRDIYFLELYLLETKKNAYETVSEYFTCDWYIINQL